MARLARGLGMNITALDPYASPAVAAAANVNLVPNLSALLPTADFLTIHTPLIASTKGMISSSEIAQMKPGSRILNVARGGTIDEAALLAALESGHLAGAAVDVFTTEPPSKDPESSAAKLIAHPKCTATPHIGASTVEAQENVSIDVCEQVIQILAGDLPRSAVNAPLILPAEYKTLQPFVRLVEKMGSLYTQHFTSPYRPAVQNTFDLIYQGELAEMTNTKPLYAALLKGLIGPISAQNVNIVNAELIARERGIFVNEHKARDPEGGSTYSSLVTLVSRPGSRAPSLARSDMAETELAVKAETRQHIISGFCSEAAPFISRIDRFSTSFVPDGTLLICHNYDEPGKIGVVGSILGREGVNINYMSVAPAGYKTLSPGSEMKGIARRFAGGTATQSGGEETLMAASESLMILGVDREVGKNVQRELVEGGGVLDVSSVTL